MDEKYQGKTCRCPHHSMTGVWLVLIGLTFLLGEYGKVSAHFVALAWPTLVILAGLSKWFGRWCKCC